jgi:predicted 3-demethylubiquinone-9 3-methyltransferase (glyoxalase superfamily)
MHIVLYNATGLAFVLTRTKTWVKEIFGVTWNLVPVNVRTSVSSCDDG